MFTDLTLSFKRGTRLLVWVQPKKVVLLDLRSRFRFSETEVIMSIIYLSRLYETTTDPVLPGIFQ